MEYIAQIQIQQEREQMHEDQTEWTRDGRARKFWFGENKGVVDFNQPPSKHDET